MSNKTITEPLPNNTSQSRTWWARFNKINGRILAITSKKINNSLIENNSDELIAEIDNPVCRDILRGKTNKKNYAILWDFNNERWNLDVKSTTLLIRPSDNKLTPIKLENPKDICDIHITIFKQDQTIFVSANLKNIAETMNLADIGYISTSESKLLDLFITKKNDPDYLVHVIPIDPEKLLNQQNLLIKLPEKINKIIDWDNVSIYTKPVFKHYGLDIRSNSVKNDIVNSQKKILYSVNYDKSESDINIYVDNGSLCVKSKLTENQIFYFGGKTKFKIIYCEQYIDNLIGKLEFDVAILSGPKEIKLPLPKDWPANPLLVHRNKKIRISYTGEKNA
jgi:hypothetical protein